MHASIHVTFLTFKSKSLEVQMKGPSSRSRRHARLQLQRQPGELPPPYCCRRVEDGHLLFLNLPLIRKSCELTNYPSLPITPLFPFCWSSFVLACTMAQRCRCWHRASCEKPFTPCPRYIVPSTRNFTVLFPPD